MKVWNKKQIEYLKKRQSFDILHPYTCICGANLIPTEKGWICEKCDYTQNWALDSDLDGSFLKWCNDWKNIKLNKNN